MARTPRGRRGEGVLALPLDVGTDAPEAAKLSGTSVRRHVGRVERHVGDSIVAARAGVPAEARWAAAEVLAKELGRALDVASANRDPYAVAQLAPKLLEALRELALTPASAQAKSDLAELLADIANPQ